MTQDAREAPGDASGWPPELELKPAEVKRILGGITDAFVALDASWRYTYVNERAGQIFSRRPRDLYGKHIWTEFPEGQGRSFQLAYERAFAEQTPLQLEDYYAPYDRWFENRIYPHREGISILFHDVTERKRMELLVQGRTAVLERISADAPLSESLDLLARTMDEQAPGNFSSILLLDEDGVHIRHAAGPNLPDGYNRAVDGAAIGPAAGSCGTAAYRRAPVIVQDIATDPLWKDWAELALRHGLRACWSTPILSSDGSVLGTFAIYRREPSAPRPHDLEIIRGATHLAKIAIESERARAALRRSNERFDIVIRGADVGIWDWDLTRNTAFYSPRWKSQLGYSPDELPDRPDTWETLLHPDDRERALLTVRDYLEGRTSTFQLEHRLRHRDGSYRWVLARGLALRDASGRALRMAGSHQDVTEQKTLEARLLQAQKMEGMGRLASGVAHDFNNVLSVILSSTELVLGRLAPGDPNAMDLEEVRRAALRASAFTRQLLLFARQRLTEVGAVDVNAVVEEMRTMLERLLGREVRLALELERPLGLVVSDVARLEQVILNLCVNARDAMPRGGTVTIATANAQLPANVPGLRGSPGSGNYVRLTVRDDGSGIAPEYLARVFEPFFTTKEAGKGTGLGLSTVEQIVQAAGGCVSVASEPGKGSSFSAFFPRLEGALERALVREEAPDQISARRP